MQSQQPRFAADETRGEARGELSQCVSNLDYRASTWSARRGQLTPADHRSFIKATSVKRCFLCVEQIEERCTPSGVVPAHGQAFGTGTIGLVRDLQTQCLSIGDICFVE